ncbi:MAG: polyprenyl diphosphate synthase [Spirochaeta sp.]|jgi:undecaprenyl diphosphate synthase|nr:polyprenyl diphosphate synthase [Spirochaeta sp.]
MEVPSVSAPAHIGIIMDGNGRWATKRNLRRTRGHREGIEAAKRVVLEAIRQEVSVLSLYAFSTENWRRAEEEVSFIMALVARNLRDQYDFYRDNRVRVRHSGDLERLPPAVRKEITAVTTETADLEAITVNIAVNYGGRDEIVRAVNRWIDSGDRSGDEEAACTEDAIREHLDQPEFPYPDLIIRTGGEKRISNFMLWECAYAELYFSDTLWPDWSDVDLRNAIEDFRARKRNYGGMR